MNKEPLPGRKARKPGGGERAAVEEATQSPLDQTEAFAMSSEEGDAADFLLSSDDDADGSELGETEAPVAKPAPIKKTRPPEKPKEATRKPKSAEQSQLDETTAPREETPAPKTSMRKAPEPEKTEIADEEDAAPAAPAAQNTAKATVLGDYRLAKKLGQGGMGSVFKAHQVSLDREVAVKVLAKELSDKPAFVQRFLREARVMARLDHPNILRCFDVGTAKGYHYLAMEFVDGGSVEGFLKKNGKFSLGDSLHIVLTTAAALQHAHEKGMVHRDIKPDNILITSKGVIKVADLGLAKAADDDLGLTKTGTGAGTPYYMAPEQARDVKHVDGRVDIYALGVMLYVFLTGEMPFRGETLVEVIEAKEKGKFASVRKFNMDVPEKLDLVIGKMLASKPEHRFASCAGVIDAIEEFGLANDRLSFIQGAVSSTPKVARSASAATSPPAGGNTDKPVAGAAAKGEAKKPEVWYWAFENEEGGRTTKKLSKAQIVTLIKSGSIDTDAQISRNAKTGFRAVASFGEFLPYLQKNIITEKVEKKGEKYRDMYKQIEQEEKSRLRWRWFQNLYLKLGGGIGFLLWMCIVGAIVVGGYFGVRWLLEFLGTTVADKAGLK